MGEVRALFGSFFVALAIVACASTETTEPTSSDADAEPPRVPDPPPRYKPLQLTDAAPIETDGGSELTIKCGRDKPYVCPLEDGTFACSSIPCLPDCTRIGCVGGDVCTSCDGGYRCVDPASGC
jgi:hypothetical protein